MAGGFPDLIKPEVPNAQSNRAPDLLLEGLRTGLQAFAQFANMRRESEDQVLRLASAERIAQEGHAVQREKINKDTEVQDALMKSHADYYDAMGTAAINRADAYARGVTGMVDQTAQKLEFQQGFQDRVNELKLNDPNLEKDDPAQYYLNVKELQRNYGTSTFPDITKAISSYKLRAEQHKIPLPKITYDENGAPIKAGHVDPNVVVGQIVEGLHDPTTRKEYMDRLKAGRYIEPGKVTDTKKGSWWQKKWVEHSQAPDTITPTGEALLNKADTGDFGSGVTVPQPDFRKKARDFRALAVPGDETPVGAPAELAPSADATSNDQSSATPQTDMFLQNALAAIRKGADPKAVAQRLQDNGIDPSLMWA